VLLLDSIANDSMRDWEEARPALLALESAAAVPLALLPSTPIEMESALVCANPLSSAAPVPSEVVRDVLPGPADETAVLPTIETPWLVAALFEVTWLMLLLPPKPTDSDSESEMAVEDRSASDVAADLLIPAPLAARLSAWALEVASDTEPLSATAVALDSAAARPFPAWELAFAEAAGVCCYPQSTAALPCCLLNSAKLERQLAMWTEELQHFLLFQVV
jgi:hypothetical protein